MADDNISQFVALTGAPVEQASHFLEAYKNDVNAAVAAFLDSDQGSASTPPLQPEQSSVAVQSSQQAQGQPSASGPQRSGSSTPSGSSSTWNRPAPTKKFATLQDIISGNNDEDEEKSKDPQNYFAGGERSGLSVQDPNKKQSKTGNPLIDQLLDKAAQNGPPPGGEGDESMDPPPSQPSEPTFSGKGNTLGSEETESEQTPDPTTTSTGLGSGLGGSMPGGLEIGDDDDASSSLPESDQVAVRHLTFWRNGFSIDDGELMDYDDPKNKETLQALNSGRAPLSLLNVRFGQRVDLRVERRMDEEYTAPEKPKQPFEGSGSRLGSYAPTPSSSSTSTPAPPTSVPALSVTEFKLDNTQPTTKVQIRLADGQRLIATMNHSHTIADLRNYINNSNPSAGSRPYVLLNSFPSTQITDESQTLKDANLLGSVVIQKYQ